MPPEAQVCFFLVVKLLKKCHIQEEVEEISTNISLQLTFAKKTTLLSFRRC